MYCVWRQQNTQMRKIGIHEVRHRTKLIRCCLKSVRKPKTFRTLFCTFLGAVNILEIEDTECVPVTDYMCI